MKVILQILNSAPPTLDRKEMWDESFKDFVSDCLQKDPSKRPSVEDIFREHKKFFSKAKNAAYLKENFLMDL